MTDADGPRGSSPFQTNRVPKWPTTERFGDRATRRFGLLLCVTRERDARLIPCFMAEHVHIQSCVSALRGGKREISKLYNLNKIKTQKKSSTRRRTHPLYMLINRRCFIYATPSSSYRCAAKCRQRSAMLLIWRGGS